MTPRARALCTPLLVLAVALPLAADAAPAKPKRFGLEGVLLDYDASRDVFRVRVTKTKVSGGFGSGGIAGAPAPRSITPGAEVEFQVVPEGSVLRRTVIKGSKGGGLDTTGTREGFARAVAVLPRDRDIVLSFEEAPEGEGPDYVLKMVQVRLSPEEIAERLRELGLDPAEFEDVTN